MSRNSIHWGITLKLVYNVAVSYIPWTPNMLPVCMPSEVVVSYPSYGKIKKRSGSETTEVDNKKTDILWFLTNYCDVCNNFSQDVESPFVVT